MTVLQVLWPTWFCLGYCKSPKPLPWKEIVKTPLDGDVEASEQCWASYHLTSGMLASHISYYGPKTWQKMAERVYAPYKFCDMGRAKSQESQDMGIASGSDIYAWSWTNCVSSSLSLLICKAETARFAAVIRPIHRYGISVSFQAPRKVVFCHPFDSTINPGTTG